MSTRFTNVLYAGIFYIETWEVLKGSEKLHVLKFCLLCKCNDVSLCVGDAISLTDGATEAAANHTNSEGMIQILSMISKDTHG